MGLGKKMKKKGKRGKGRGKEKKEWERKGKREGEREKGGREKEKRKKGKGKGKGKRKGGRGKEKGAPKHSIILLKSKCFLCKGGSAPPAPPPRSRNLSNTPVFKSWVRGKNMILKKGWGQKYESQN